MKRRPKNVQCPILPGQRTRSTHCPREFRDNVVAVARRGNAPVTQIAKDFGISESCLRNWLAKADVEDGLRPGTTTTESLELRELKRRNRLLEQENEVLRRAAAYLSQANLPGNDVPARA